MKRQDQLWHFWWPHAGGHGVFPIRRESSLPGFFRGGRISASETSQGGDGETHDIVFWDMAWGGEDGALKAMENQLQTEMKKLSPALET